MQTRKKRSMCMEISDSDWGSNPDFTCAGVLAIALSRDYTIGFMGIHLRVSSQNGSYISLSLSSRQRRNVNELYAAI